MFFNYLDIFKCKISARIIDLGDLVSKKFDEVYDDGDQIVGASTRDVAGTLRQ